MSLNENPNQEVISRIEKIAGTRIENYSLATTGYTPALRLVCQGKDSRFFAKVGVTSATSQFLRREIAVYKKLNEDFMPKLVGYDESEVDPILIIEDLSHCHWPPMWNQNYIELVLEQVEKMHNTQVDMESFLQVHGEWNSSWKEVEKNPRPFLSIGFADEKWLTKNLPLLIENEMSCSPEGNSFIHLDLRSDNICFTENKCLIIDWNHSCLGNAKLDLGFWLPSLAYEGGPNPEEILPDAPEIAAWISGFFAANAGLPMIKDAPHVRTVQKKQLRTSLAWAIRALGLEPLENLK
ncbi:phosphotransferase [Candidatus Uabimicrobium amorphum]|uniref:Aminoglycoside phosphotransferase domain-containing protein n=1 Tax=Uabimicrobium amorphum TaxID=2596890 RepID=A0A5S9F691_UABAM|nr:phosphotransferase [Candidatus Uabimicrobium amorphum]BBM86374.1 hypothetical protein UABAM_04760 [Candidatus Uabimicrobium amorphum]